MKQKPEDLWLENQICFPLYAASRMVTRLYTPLLDELEITYPQYLVLLVLWRKDQQSVTDIRNLIYLESNTLTPLLKRMENKGLIQRKRSETDERKVLVSLTEKGKALKEKAACIPEQIINQFGSDEIGAGEVIRLQETLSKLIHLPEKEDINKYD